MSDCAWNIDHEPEYPCPGCRIRALEVEVKRLDERGVSNRGSGTQSGSRLQVPAAAKPAARHSPAENQECGM